MRKLRIIAVLFTAGIVWFLALNLFFVLSGAQSVLADPAYQSEKFLRAFTAEPPPRSAESFSLLLAGFMTVGAIAAAAFVWLDGRIGGGWLKKGLLFGLVHWALMVPWFEFYLPFNVMREPFALVLLEMLLWLGVTLTLGLYISFVLNFKKS